MSSKKKIVIVGAGFGGVAAALGLERVFRHDNLVEITIIDKHNYHVFNSNLYEAATAEEELVSISEVKRSVAVPLSEIFKGKKVTVLTAEVSDIDAAGKTLQAGGKKLSFDYLITGFGSVSDDFGIPGVAEFAIPLKTLRDAFAIRSQLAFVMDSHRLDVNKKNIRIVVAGGGYTGVELAAELAGEMEYLAWKNQYPPEKIEITIVEAMPQVIAGFSTKLSQDAVWKLKDRGVRVLLSSPITSVERTGIKLISGEQLPYDLLVWTTGVKAGALPFTAPLEVDRKGRVITNGYLQVKSQEYIYAIGDSASVNNVDGRPAPPTAQDAIAHGKYVAYALPLIMENQRPEPYIGKKHGFIVTLGGKYAIMDYGGLYVKGFLGFLFRYGATFRYYMSIVGIWKAVQYIVFQARVNSRND